MWIKKSFSLPLMVSALLAQDSPDLQNAANEGEGSAPPAERDLAGEFEDLTEQPVELPPVEQADEEWTDSTRIGGFEYYGAPLDDPSVLEAIGLGNLDGLEMPSSREWYDGFGFSVGANVQYNDNVQRFGGIAGGQLSDVIFSASPAVTYQSLEGGRSSIQARYSASILQHVENDNLNRINHALSASYAYELPKTRLSATLGFQIQNAGDQFFTEVAPDNPLTPEDDPVVRALGGQVGSTSWRLGLQGTHDLTAKSNLNLDLGFNDQRFDGNAGGGNAIDRTSLTGRFSWQYQMTAKTRLGPYLSGETTSVALGPDQSAIGLGAAIDYALGPKTSLSGFIGTENRSFSGVGAASSQLLFTYNLAANYSLSSKIALSGSFFRRAQPGFGIANIGFISTGLQIGGSYQFDEKLSFRSNVGYTMDETFASGTAIAANNFDRSLISFSTGANYRFNDDWSLGANLSYRKNESDQSNVNFNFDNFILSLNATYTFR